MSKRPNVPERMTALHEAGHTVAALTFGWPIACVSIVNNGVAEGQVNVGEVDGIDELGVEAGVQKLETALVVLFAGNLAASAGGEVQEFRGTDDDYDHAVVVLEELLRVTPWVGDFKSFVKFQMLRPQHWVYRNLGAINALAEELLDRKTMSGDEVSTVVQAFRVRGQQPPPA